MYIILVDDLFTNEHFGLGRPFYFPVSDHPVCISGVLGVKRAVVADRGGSVAKPEKDTNR